MNCELSDAFDEMCRVCTAAAPAGERFWGAFHGGALALRDVADRSADDCRADIAHVADGPWCFDVHRMDPFTVVVEGRWAGQPAAPPPPDGWWLPLEDSIVASSGVIALVSAGVFRSEEVVPEGEWEVWRCHFAEHAGDRWMLGCFAAITAAGSPAGSTLPSCAPEPFAREGLLIETDAALLTEVWVARRPGDGRAVGVRLAMPHPEP